MNGISCWVKLDEIPTEDVRGTSGNTNGGSCLLFCVSPFREWSTWIDLKTENVKQFPTRVKCLAMWNNSIQQYFLLQYELENNAFEYNSYYKKMQYRWIEPAPMSQQVSFGISFQRRFRYGTALLNTSHNVWRNMAWNQVFEGVPKIRFRKPDPLWREDQFYGQNELQGCVFMLIFVCVLSSASEKIDFKRFRFDEFQSFLLHSSNQTESIMAHKSILWMKSRYFWDKLIENDEASANIELKDAVFEINLPPNVEMEADILKQVLRYVAFHTEVHRRLIKTRVKRERESWNQNLVPVSNPNQDV